MKFKVLAVFTAALFCAETAIANDLIDATDPQKILNIARGFGSANLEKNSQGDPKITGRIDGTRYEIHFYGCVKHRQCDDILFSAGWSTRGMYSLEDINRWNSKRRYGKAYLNDDKDVVLDMVANIDYGVSRHNLEDTFDWWSKVLREFKKEVLKSE